MNTYDTFLAHAPAALGRRDHDLWFEEHDYEIEDLIRVGREVAENRLHGLRDGTKLSEDDLSLALISAFLFGVELTLRVEREEPTRAPATDG